MGRTPPLFRIIPTPIRRKVKASLRPYAERFFEAYLEGYQRTHQTGGMHPRLASSATHLPVVQRESDRPGEPWGYMLPKADPDAPKWSDGLPIPPKHLWHGYTADTAMMMEVGRRNADALRRILGQTGDEPKVGDKLLDFGCAAGFVLRNLLEIATDRDSGGEVWGVDFSSPHIDWCIRHLMPPFRFALTSSLPALPFADGHFDLAYCFSVFSHMGENCEGWLAELARVLRPGGRLFLTVVTKESMWDYFQHRPKLGFSTAMRRRFTDEQLRSNFSVAVVQNGPGCHSVFDLDDFKAKCACAFEVAAVVPNAHSYQWGIVLRKPQLQTRPEVVVRPGEYRSRV